MKKCGEWNGMEDFASKAAAFDRLIGAERSFDLVRKEFAVGKKKGIYYLINAFGNGALTEKLLAFLTGAGAAEAYTRSFESLFLSVPYAEATAEPDAGRAQYALMSGNAVVLLEGADAFLIFDTRNYPSRGIEEPEKDRTLRGSRDGFVESLVPNTGLLRRRIRDPRFRIEKQTVGSRTMTDIAICYIEGLADASYVESLRKRITAIKVEGLNMGMESLAEVFVKGYWNPFPKIRYTERPDTACATIMEGGVILLCDNYPSAMLLPTSIFDFMQDTDDYYFPPLIGGYLKIIRMGTYLLSIFFTPLWYLFLLHPDWLPSGIAFLGTGGTKEAALPILAQLFLLEFAIDGLKLASLNTPDSLTNSLSVIGGLLIGDYAVSVGWLSEATILYMAFVAIANFTQPNYELGYAFKLMRLITLVLISLFGLWGFLGGIALTILMILTNPTTGGRSYLYPLIPFNGRALRRLFFRAKLQENMSKQ